MTLNVSLTPHLEDFIRQTVNSGRYQSASEVVRTALRLLEHEEREQEARLAALRAAIDEGESSGIAAGDPFSRVREALAASGKRP
jgi:antitoxin ParD1/3/4